MDRLEGDSTGHRSVADHGSYPTGVGPTEDTHPLFEADAVAD
uniref:Unannotated protein n=1 Tax=freshwater metagenome TaxID=449393 RepID=A0A6J5ZYZ1_9ZZZZ